MIDLVVAVIGLNADIVSQIILRIALVADLVDLATVNSLDLLATITCITKVDPIVEVARS